MSDTQAIARPAGEMTAPASGKGRKAGRTRHRFTQERRQAFLDAIPEAKGNLTLAAQLAGIPPATVFDHMTYDPPFLAQVNRCKALLSHTLVKVAYERGLQAQGTQDRWKLIHAWNPTEYSPTPTVQLTVNHAQLAFGDGSPAFPQVVDVVTDGKGDEKGRRV